MRRSKKLIDDNNVTKIKCELCGHNLSNYRISEDISYHKCHNGNCGSNYMCKTNGGVKESDAWEHILNGRVSLVENDYINKTCEITTCLPRQLPKANTYEFNIPPKKFESYIPLL